MKALLSTFAMLMLFLSSFAQTASMADHMRSEGKIYVVVGVIVLIFVVLFAYLIFLDLRLRKAENENR